MPLRYGVTFGPIGASIIDHIQSHPGISNVDLLNAVYRERRGATLGTLKGYVGYINWKLTNAGVAIRLDRSQCYRLITTARASA
jgi:hypothetical protein